MKRNIRKLIYLSVFFLLVIEPMASYQQSKLNYNDHEFLSITPKEQSQLNKLKELEESEDFAGLDFCEKPFAVNKRVRILVNPRIRQTFYDELQLVELGVVDVARNLSCRACQNYKSIREEINFWLCSNQLPPVITKYILGRELQA